MDKENTNTTNNAERPKQPDTISLQCIGGPSKGMSYTKQAKKITIGRTGKSVVHLKDTSVSEKHADIQWDGKAWMYTDRGSSNGTLVNGKELAEDEPVALKDGDVITVGVDSEVRVELQPHPDETVTVEEFLRGECERMVERIKGRADSMCAGLREEAEAIKADLRETAASA